MKLREIKRFVVAAIAAAAIAPIAFLNNNASAAPATYKDYGDVPPILSEDYSSSRIYYTNNTKITVKKPGVDADSAGTVIASVANGNLSINNHYFLVDPGRELVILVENSTARDASGNPIDVIFRVNNTREFTRIFNRESGDDITQAEHEAGDFYFRFALRNKNCGSGVELPGESDCTEHTENLVVNDPIIFWINTRFMVGDFSVEYIKKGTYNETTAQGTPAGVQKTTYMSYDYDVLENGYSILDDNFFDAYEGSRVDPNDPSTTTYYYHKTNNQTDTHLAEVSNGLRIDQIKHSSNFDGIYFGGSFFAMAEGMENSKYTFTYSATNAGISVFFGSPVGYETPAPTKVINVDATSNRVKPGETFKYVIKQYVPETFSSRNDVLTYASLWANYDNINEDHNYDKFIISDTLDSHLNVPAASAIKVYNGSTDVTSNFTIAVSGQTITVTAKANYLTNPALYGTTISVSFNTSVKSPTDIAQLTNSAKTTYSYTGLDDEEKITNVVTTSIYHTLTVKHLDQDTNEELVDTVSSSHDHGYSYRTSALTGDDLPDHYELVSTPDNANGTLNKDETVIYYYKTNRHTLTVRHLDKSTGEEIADTTEETHPHGYEYTTNPAEDLPEGYKLIETPENAEGTLDEDTVVIYYYIKNPNTFSENILPFTGAFIGAATIAAGLYFAISKRR